MKNGSRFISYLICLKITVSVHGTNLTEQCAEQKTAYLQQYQTTLSQFIGNFWLHFGFLWDTQTRLNFDTQMFPLAITCKYICNLFAILLINFVQRTIQNIELY